MEIRKLPRWVKLALVRVHFLGISTKKAAIEARRNPKTLSQWRRAPAAKAWIAQIAEVADDPVTIAQAQIRASALDLSIDALMNLEVAKLANDYKEVGIILRDLMDRAGVAKAAPPTQKIVLQIGSSTMNLEGSSGKGDYEIIDAEIDYEYSEVEL